MVLQLRTTEHGNRRRPAKTEVGQSGLVSTPEYH